MFFFFGGRGGEDEEETAAAAGDGRRIESERKDWETSTATGVRVSRETGIR